MFLLNQTLDAYCVVHRPASVPGPVLPGERPVRVPGADDAFSVLNTSLSSLSSHHRCHCRNLRLDGDVGDVPHAVHGVLWDHPGHVGDLRVGVRVDSEVEAGHCVLKVGEKVLPERAHHGIPSINGLIKGGILNQHTIQNCLVEHSALVHWNWWKRMSTRYNKNFSENLKILPQWYSYN